MKKFFSFTFAFFMMISMVALVGCNGLWDFDDDDDAVLPPTNFTVSGNVLVPASQIGNLRAVQYTDLKVQAYNLKKNTDGTVEEVAIGNPSDVIDDGDGTYSYEHNFASYTGSGYYFFVKVYATGFEMRNALGQLSSNNPTVTGEDVDTSSTAEAFLILRSVVNGTELSDLDPETFDPTTDPNWNNVLSVIENNLGSNTLFDENTDPTTLTNASGTAMAVSATAVSITNEASISNMVVGDKEPLTADIEPSYATVNWSSSNPSIASITRGILTALAEGTTTVTVSDGQGTSDSVTVTVAAAEVNVEGVTLNKSTTSIAEGASETLTATVAPTNATNKSVTWSSNNESVAKVDSNGLVTGVAEGNATITVTTADGSFTATCAVTVTAAPTTTEVTFDDTVTGGSTSMAFQLENTSGGLDTSVTFSLTDVNDGTVQFVAEDGATGSKIKFEPNPSDTIANFVDFNKIEFDKVLPSGSTMKIADGDTGTVYTATVQ